MSSWHWPCSNRWRKRQVTQKRWVPKLCAGLSEVWTCRTFGRSFGFWPLGHVLRLTPDTGEPLTRFATWVGSSRTSFARCSNATPGRSRDGGWNGDAARCVGFVAGAWSWIVGVKVVVFVVVVIIVVFVFVVAEVAIYIHLPFAMILMMLMLYWRYSCRISVFLGVPKTSKNIQLLHFEWSPPWHHIITYLSQILTFFVLKSGEDEKERIILMKSRALRSLDFIRIILSSSSLLLVRGPAVTTVIYLAKLIQTDSHYAWFETISDARASPDAYTS